MAGMMPGGGGGRPPPMAFSDMQVDNNVEVDPELFGIFSEMATGLDDPQRSGQTQQQQNPFAMPHADPFNPSYPFYNDAFLNNVGGTAEDDVRMSGLPPPHPNAYPPRSSPPFAQGSLPTGAPTTTPVADMSSLRIDSESQDAQGGTVPYLDLQSPSRKAKSKRLQKNQRTSSGGAQALSPYYSSQHAPMDDDDDEEGDDDDEGRSKRRLARKAELARQSRRRKKQYVQDLEDKVRALGAELEKALRRKPPAETREEKDRKVQQTTIRKRLSEIVRHPVSDEKSVQTVSQLVQKFVENSRERQAMAFYHLDRAMESIIPGLQVKFALWGLDQNDDFYTKSGLWTELMDKHVGVTPDQLRRITARREEIHKQRIALSQCQKMLRDTRAAIEMHTKNLNSLMDELVYTLTPVQLGKFYVWVEENEWCMQMLNNVWALPAKE